MDAHGVMWIEIWSGSQFLVNPWPNADTERKSQFERIDDKGDGRMFDAMGVSYSGEVGPVPEAGSIVSDGKLDSSRARTAIAAYRTFRRFKSFSLKSSRLMKAF